ncbi:MAG: aminoglycoside phosphotransferase family protein [Chloroflexi bacterium]|nr:aminoglycoside phosphotransferase family protein [Chloroflexota bacterium]
MIGELGGANVSIDTGTCGPILYSSGENAQVLEAQFVDYVKTLDPVALGITKADIDDIQVADLPKGVWSFSYWVRIGPKQFVFKVHPPLAANKGLLLENSGLAEFLSLKRIVHLDIAPQPILFDDTGKLFGRPVLIYEYARGTMLTFSDQAMVKVAEIYSKLHTLDVSEEKSFRIRDETLIGLMRDVEERFAIYENRDDVSPQQAQHFCQYVEMTKVHIAGKDLGTCPMALIHADPTPSNFVVGPQVVLIDWQTPMIGDPAYDIWAFTSDAFTLWDSDRSPTPAQKALFRDTYLTLREDQTFGERMILKEPLYLLQYGLHCAIRYCDYESGKIPPHLVKGREANYEKYRQTRDIILARLREILVMD